MADVQQHQYVDGPFAGGVAPDGFIDRIDMRGSAGSGAYVQERDDETGLLLYVWHPEA
ncbi:hypothetical protein ACPCSC_30710 [Streptomyces lavendulocolor]|uniref:hypothetical protein n=1 Tax=Streptomyces lavendulocolor TaxID=67316 RepID=UPI003C2EFD7D